VIVGSAAPIEVYRLVNQRHYFTVYRETKGQLTNSTAVRRMESAREFMMHQNFQSFGTPRERSLGNLGEDNRDGGESMAELAKVQVGEICRGEKQGKLKGGILKREATFN
jgi:hypothetical protein